MRPAWRLAAALAIAGALVFPRAHDASAVPSPPDAMKIFAGPEGLEPGGWSRTWAPGL